jgi:hypothetical protein
MANGSTQDNMDQMTPFVKALRAAGMNYAMGGAPAYEDQNPEEIPDQYRHPVHRIDDEQSQGRRGGSPTGGVSYNPNAPAGHRQPVMDASVNSMHPFNPAIYPLEQEIQSEQQQLAAAQAPRPKPPMAARLAQAIGSGLAAFSPRATQNLEENKQLAQQRELAQQAQNQALAARIAENQRALSTEQIRGQQMEQQERMRELAEQSQWDRLQATLAGRMQQVGAQQTGAEQRAQESIAAANQRFATGQQNKLDMFKQTQQYQIWKAKLDNDTKLRVAALTQSKAPAAIMQTAEFATGGLNLLADARTALEDLKSRGVLGSVTSDKLEDWIFGKGLVDPNLDPQTRREIGQLRSALGYTSSAAMRAHTGRTSMEIYDDFKRGLGLGQGIDALEGTMDETEKMLGQYSQAASDENIMRMRQGIGPQNVPPPNAPPAGAGAGAPSADPFAQFGGKAH